MSRYIALFLLFLSACAMQHLLSQTNMKVRASMLS